MTFEELHTIYEHIMSFLAMANISFEDNISDSTLYQVTGAKGGLSKKRPHFTFLIQETSSRHFSEDFDTFVMNGIREISKQYEVKIIFHPEPATYIKEYRSCILRNIGTYSFFWTSSKRKIGIIDYSPEPFYGMQHFDDMDVADLEFDTYAEYCLAKGFKMDFNDFMRGEQNE